MQTPRYSWPSVSHFELACPPGAGTLLGMRLEPKAACLRRDRKRSNHVFRNPCRSRFHSHPLQCQPLPGKARTCLEGPFGEVLRESGPMAMASPLRFSTKYQDDETGLLYYGLRFYNANTGRWNSRDLHGEEGLLGLVRFTRNDPIRLIDYLGLDVLCPFEGGVVRIPGSAPSQRPLSPPPPVLLPSLSSRANCCPLSKPINVTVAAPDAPNSPPSAALLESYSNIGRMLMHIALDVHSGECVRRLTISAHGWSMAVHIGGRLAPQPVTPKGRINNETAITPQNAKAVGEHLRNLVCLCKPCEIYLLSCHSGLGTIGQLLAVGSGCTVHAPNGFERPNYEHPDQTYVAPEDPEEDYVPEGSGDQMLDFEPN